MQLPVTAILLAFGTALLITPWVRKWAFKCGALDRPNRRKVHERLMPRLGGLAIYLSFVASVMITSQEVARQAIGLIIGGSLIVLLGVIDDTRGVSPRIKLAGQVLAAFAVIPFGLKVEFITNPLSAQMITLGLFSIPVTVLWLVSVTNAVNLIDGLDGLAGGTTFIALLTLAATVWIEVARAGSSSPGQEVAVILALILAGAVFGFLRYNFYPARIFLGDSGSMFLGYSVAVLAIMGLAKGPTFISVIIPVVILGIPLLDTVFAIVRRYCGHRPIFQPDKEHLHHRLMDMGLSHRQTVLCIYAINIILSLSAIIMTMITQKQAVLLLAVLSTTILIVANKIGVTGIGKPGSYLPHSGKQQRPSGM
ncbi:MAG: putative undecaprenyl-phosphate N-acetylglucosaminyl 1-phosphate transferase [Pelotomaculum sp. PtaB.Bin013]|uniref:Undecaprenyl/decaprenyl-phosphate alpha-N-acetylglucosaminyl 1-phosphate transferase n=1 Tax=Pelotomaculum isophthalicicum JI TaxID=947010 RepID=A0A9X4H6I9_9FIRM|nr:MraY family glycosyltransferase [Pelotomaculum isophthalicicum]MDF9406964.1 undecaprenyl/decaprenyl-phosphate alpha-N-acetylglucosaminyl 1-phosphate transferase [Pelotomaculum isophthalicicum JI]OPX83136.1 MAG: putative undecaprenyl-phosphate N-acetylglucosaminyl 1-phosphate transferase [Pelotomaculum sp. PtaB.Bin013]